MKASSGYFRYNRYQPYLSIYQSPRRHCNETFSEKQLRLASFQGHQLSRPVRPISLLHLSFTVDVSPLIAPPLF